MALDAINMAAGDLWRSRAGQLPRCPLQIANQPYGFAAVTAANDDFRLEATDPGLFATLNLMWSPLYGKINPFGMAVVNLDLYFSIGGGYGFEQVELLQFDPSLQTNGLPENSRPKVTPMNAMTTLERIMNGCQ